MMHRKPRFVHGTALLGLFAACGAPSPVTPAGEVQTTLTGVTALEGPEAFASVRIQDGLPHSDSVFASATSDELGAWMVDVGPLFGPMRVSASIAGAGVLESWLVAEQGVAHSGLQVSPLTTLAVAWMQGAVSRGETAPVAWAQANDLVFGHLGGLDFLHQQGADLRDYDGVVVDDAVRAGLLAHGLAEQARRLSRQSEGQGAASISLLQLVAAYGRDLDDGLADGLDRYGAPVRVGGVALTPDSLRLDLSLSVAAFLDGPRNGSVFRSADVADLLGRLRDSDSALFPEGSLAARDTSGPRLGVQLQQEGRSLVDGEVIAGTLSLVVSATDESGVADIRGWWVDDGAGSEVLVGEAAWSEAAIWDLAINEMPEGRQVVRVEATDTLGYVSSATAAFVADQTPPTVMLQAPERVTTATVGVRGRWFDRYGVRQVVLRVDGDERVRLETPGETFEATVPLGCRSGETKTVSAEAVDRAGLVSEAVTVRVACAGQGPALVLLGSDFIDERQLVLVHGPGGMLTQAYFPPVPQRVRLDESTVWPVRLHKYFSRLDEVSGQSAQSLNLPVFRLRATADVPVTVAYRHLVDGQEARPWTTVTPNATGDVVLPVSYQALGPTLVTAGPDVVQVLEVRAQTETDEVSRRFSFYLEALSPPVWLGGCEGALTPSLARTGLSVGAEAALETAQVVWDLGVDETSLAPNAAALLELVPPSSSVEISALGEIKWQAGVFTPIPFGGMAGTVPRPSNGCWGQGNPVALFHEVQGGFQAGACLSRLLPDETVRVAVAGPQTLGRLVTVQVMQGLWVSGQSLSPTPRGRFSVVPGVVHELRLTAEQPRLQLPNGAPLVWDNMPQPPMGWASGAQWRGPRYPGFERQGTDYRAYSTGGLEGRPFETRTYVSEVRAAVEALVGQATHSTLSGVEVPVVVDAACDALRTQEVQL